MTAEELLKNTTDIQPYNATERCVIDPETRVITIPATYQRLGVENDKLVERIEFQCPKIVGDNKNLTEFQLRINYRNANDEKDQYIVKDVREEGENILFSWELSRKVTAYRGIVSFIVCAVIVSDDFTVSNEWNTTVAESEVLEGLEASTQIIQENPDIIEEILKRLDTLETNGGGGGIAKETDPTVPAWAKEPTKPTYTATEVGADAAGTAVSKVTEHNTAGGAHADIRLLVQGLTDRLNVLADSDDETLDQMSEIVAYIKSNKSLIDGITTGKVSVTDIVDNLTTNASNKPLSAAQGVALKALIDGITIPTTLPNPQKLKFTGAVTAEYDGSAEQTVNIPTSGGSYTLPIMSDTQLGGGKAIEKTTESVPVAVDEDGKLWIPEQTEGGVSVSYDQEKKAIVFSSGGGIDNTSINLVNPSEYTNSGYSGTLFDEFGANVNVFNTEIDTSENKTLYYRVYRNNQIYDHKVGTKVACYDSGGSFLFLMHDSTGDYVANFESISGENGNNSEPLEIVGDKKVIVKQIGLINIPENVKKVKFGIAGNSNMIPDFYPVFAVSYSKITNYGSITNSDYSLTQGSTSEGGGSGTAVYKPLLNKTFLMIGDSLTNWGGGGDTANGFLKIVHDKTGVTTVNQGLAGATWEEADGQTQPGVKRVDTYVSGSVRYDCIGFLLGTNVSNVGTVSDTSETKTTMCGAIKYCLEKLISLSPTTPIIVFLPPQRAEGNEGQKTRNDLIRQICEMYAVPTFDLYARSQVIPNTVVANNGTLSDGLHLSEKGQENIGRIMTSSILDVMGY